MVTSIQQALALLPAPQMQVETEKERVSLLETLLQTQKELADASQQLERLRQDMKAQKLKEQVWRVAPSREGEGTLGYSFNIGASVGQALHRGPTHGKHRCRLQRTRRTWSLPSRSLRSSDRQRWADTKD